MKTKKHHENKKNQKPAQTAEEFFQLPRAEVLTEQLQNGKQQIGDLVTNPALRPGDRFTLEIKDNSMEAADIRAGDYVIVKKESVYPEGCILAVQLGEKQLVRRYTRAAGRIHLQCDPPSRQTIIVEEHTPDFKILGRVAQVIREIR